MLSHGFKDQLDELVAALPRVRDRQTLLLSATFPPAVREAAAAWMSPGAEEISISKDNTVGAAEQVRPPMRARRCACAREVRSFAHEEDTQVWFPFLQTHSQYQQPIVLASAGA